MSRPPITALAFDWGERRIGVAVGQSVTGTARALGLIARRNQRIDWDAVSRVIADWKPDQLVVGKPGTADGVPHRLAPLIDRFMRQLEGRYQLPVSPIEERLSSWEAAHADPDELDAEAARVILETWFAVYSRGG